MKKQLFSIAIAFLIGMGGVMAQSLPNRGCGTMDYLEQQLKDDPAMRLRMEQIEQQTQNYMAASNANKTSMVVTIPVVFHVLYSTNNATQNISDARIMEQLNVLNLDFAHQNADAGNCPAVFLGLAANTGIQFCLAVRDPSGATTTGIIRKQTATTSFSQNNAVKFNAQGGDDAWPTASYMNVWVCNLGGGLLGYAQFPGGTANTDGVVLLNGSVGGPAAPGTSTPYHLGRTATHEVGHWLNLRHIWGDANCGNDLVSDTPTQQEDNGGCPAFPHVTCANGPNGDMFMNYMDYVNDNCMNLFTAGQSTRANAVLSAGGARASLTSSQGCVPVGGGCGTPTGISATSITSTSATLNWTGVSGGTNYYIQYRVSGTTTWNPTIITTTTSTALTGLTASTIYEYRVGASCSSTYGPYSTIHTFTTSATGGCGTPTSIAALNIQQTSAAINWFSVAGATSYRVQYRVNGTTTWTTKTATGSPKVLTGLTASTTYQYRVRAVCSVLGPWSAIYNFTTLAPSGCTGTDIYEPNDVTSAAAFINPNTYIYGIISTSTDKDFYKVTTTAAAPKLKIVVDQLPADYDVKLNLGSSGALLGSSANAGTTAETIIYNGGTTGVAYKIQVYGYNGVYVPTSCYRVRASTSASNWREMGSAEAGTENTGSLSLYPNPATDELTIDLVSAKNQTSTIDVVDMIGRSVLITEEELAEGVNKIDVDLSNLQKGVYTVRVNMNGQILMQKLVIQK